MPLASSSRASLRYVAAVLVLVSVMFSILQTSEERPLLTLAFGQGAQIRTSPRTMPRMATPPGAMPRMLNDVLAGSATSSVVSPINLVSPRDMSVSAKKKKKVWSQMRHSTRTSVRWIPKVSEMTFRVWNEHRSMSNEEITDFISEWFAVHPETELHIGADSKKRGASTAYVIGICLYKRGHGGTVLYHRKVVPTAGSEMERLWVELEMAMETANYLKAELGENKKIFVHVDYNPDARFKVSNALYSSGMAWIKSMGFDGIAKPDAWAASSVADKLT